MIWLATKWITTGTGVLASRGNTWNDSQGIVTGHLWQSGEFPWISMDFHKLRLRSTIVVLSLLPKYWQGYGKQLLGYWKWHLFFKYRKIIKDHQRQRLIETICMFVYQVPKPTEHRPNSSCQGSEHSSTSNDEGMSEAGLDDRLEQKITVKVCNHKIRYCNTVSRNRIIVNISLCHL